MGRPLSSGAGERGLVQRSSRISNWCAASRGGAVPPGGAAVSSSCEPMVSCGSGAHSGASALGDRRAAPDLATAAERPASSDRVVLHEPRTQASGATGSRSGPPSTDHARNRLLERAGAYSAPPDSVGAARRRATPALAARPRPSPVARAGGVAAVDSARNAGEPVACARGSSRTGPASVASEGGEGGGGPDAATRDRGPRGLCGRSSSVLSLAGALGGRTGPSRTLARDDAGARGAADPTGVDRVAQCVGAAGGRTGGRDCDATACRDPGPS